MSSSQVPPVLSAAIWSSVFCGVGYFFGQHPPALGHGLVRGALIVAVGLGVIVTIAVDSLLKIVLTHIAVNGPRLRPDVLQLAKKEDASLVVCGHSHVPFANHDRGVTVFNPGSAGPRRFQLPILFGVVRIRRDGVTLEHIDCETGKKWKPTSPRT